MAQKGRYVYDWPRPMVTVDAVVFCDWDDETHVLLIQRGHAPYAGHWAVPGGFLELDEDLVDGAARELAEETGLANVALTQFHTFGAIGRDPRGRLITVAFLGVVNVASAHTIRAGDDAAQTQWFPVNTLPERLAFDHNDMVRRALAHRANFFSK